MPNKIMPIPGCCAISNSKSTMFTTIGAINTNANARFMFRIIIRDREISRILTTNRYFVENKTPINVATSPDDGGIGIKLKK